MAIQETAVIEPAQSRERPAGATSAGPGPVKFGPALLGAAALWAIAIYFLLNIALSLGTGASQRLHSKPEEKAATYQACDSAIEQFRQAATAPQVVLIGSSVVMAPLWSVDARSFAGVADVYHHHRSLELSRLLAQ